MGPVGFWGPFLALPGRFLTPLGLSVGPNVYILSFWRYQNHLEPNEKWFEHPRNVILYENTYLRKTRFWPQIWPFCTQNGPKWGPLANFGVLRVPDHLGTEINWFRAKKILKKCVFLTKALKTRKIFLKNVFSYKMTFRGSSNHFSLGSKWFWYLQNDKMYTLGPTESPRGVRNGPRRANNGPQNPTGPILAYFGSVLGPSPKFS